MQAIRAVLSASRHSDVGELRRLLDANPKLVNAGDYYMNAGDGPLHQACEWGSMATIRLLLDRGASIDGKNNVGTTPLMRACAAGRPGVVALLLARGADPTRHDGVTGTALMHASVSSGRAGLSDYPAVIRLLLQDGRVPVDAVDYSMRTALWLACAEGHVARAEVLLVEGGADHDVRRFGGVTAMNTARQWWDPRCTGLIEWYEGELQKSYLLRKARALVDDTEVIGRAVERAGAKTRAKVHPARVAAAPAYLKARVRRGKPLPVLQAAGQSRGRKRVRGQDGEDERSAVLHHVVSSLNADLFAELMEGLDVGKRRRSSSRVGRV